MKQKKDNINFELLKIDKEFKKKKVKTRFYKIAKKLLNQTILQCNDDNSNFINYRIVELECYWYSKNTFNDPKSNVYPRKCNAGYVFLHKSGFDISFESDATYYGGALIRGIKDLNTNKYIFGPKKVRKALFKNKIKLFSLQKNPTLNDKIISTKRVNINNDNEYRYVVDYMNFKNAENIKLKEKIAYSIARKFGQCKAREFLGYLTKDIKNDFTS